MCLINLHPNLDVCRVGIEEAIALKVEAHDIIRLLVLHIADGKELYHADLVFDGFGLEVGIVDAGRDHFVHWRFAFSEAAKIIIIINCLIGG